MLLEVGVTKVDYFQIFSQLRLTSIKLCLIGRGDGTGQNDVQWMGPRIGFFPGLFRNASKLKAIMMIYRGRSDPKTQATNIFSSPDIYTSKRGRFAPSKAILPNPINYPTERYLNSQTFSTQMPKSYCQLPNGSRYFEQ